MDSVRIPSVTGPTATAIGGTSSKRKTAGISEGQRRKLESACQQMESLFVQEMMKSMRKSIDKSTLFHGGRAEEIYTELYDQQISQKITESGGVGLYRMLYEQIQSKLTNTE
jgi:peptidoglycan hydrolase FlgJ